MQAITPPKIHVLKTLDFAIQTILILIEVFDKYFGFIISSEIANFGLLVLIQLISMIFWGIRPAPMQLKLLRGIHLILFVVTLIYGAFIIILDQVAHHPTPFTNLGYAIALIVAGMVVVGFYYLVTIIEFFSLPSRENEMEPKDLDIV
jgi:hypothetical protein